MNKRVGILLVVCLSFWCFGLLLAGCGGNVSTSSGAESARSATESHAAEEGSASQSTTSATSVDDSAASTSDSSADADADSSASTNANSATSPTSSASKASSSATSSSASSASSASATSAASSPDEKADDGLIDVYNIESMDNNGPVRFVRMHMSAAMEWGDAAVEGDVASIWAYNMALEMIEPGWLEDEVELWQRYNGAEDEKTSSVAGYAIDGQVAYVVFKDTGGETWMSGFFDKNGKLVFLIKYGGDSYYHYAFKDDVLISETGGNSSSRLRKPKFIGEWDEDERLAEQEKLLDIAYSNFALLRVDDMENIGEIPNDFRFGE